MRNIAVEILNEDDDVSRSGPAIFVGQVYAGSFIPLFGDTDAAGTVKIQFSNEAPAPGPNPNAFVPSAGSWKDVPSASSAITAGVGPGFLIPVMSFQYIRAVFTQSNPGTDKVIVQANFTTVQ